MQAFDVPEHPLDDRIGPYTDDPHALDLLLVTWGAFFLFSSSISKYCPQTAHSSEPRPKSVATLMPDAKCANFINVYRNRCLHMMVLSSLLDFNHFISVLSKFLGTHS